MFLPRRNEMTTAKRNHTASGELPIVVSSGQGLLARGRLHEAGSGSLLRSYFSEARPLCQRPPAVTRALPRRDGGRVLLPKGGAEGYASRNTDQAAPPPKRWLHELRRGRPPHHTARPCQSGLYRCSRGRKPSQQPAAT